MLFCFHSTKYGTDTVIVYVSLLLAVVCNSIIGKQIEIERTSHAVYLYCTEKSEAKLTGGKCQSLAAHKARTTCGYVPLDLCSEMLTNGWFQQFEQEIKQK